MKRLAFGMIAMTMVAGCKKPQPVAAPATQPTARDMVLTTAPATQPISATYMLVGDESVEFPPARIVVKQPGEKLAALLFSADPPQAIEADYRGNSFYFNMAELSLEDPASINGAIWSFHAPSSDRQDSNDGLTIHNRQWQLQPFDVQVLVEGESSPLHIKLAGTFLKFDNSNEQSPGVRIPVKAQFDAELKK